MLENADIDYLPLVDYFVRHDLEVAFLSPTDTGLKKAILDAIEPVRTFLKVTGLHDYSIQVQGIDGKVTIPAFFVNASAELTPAEASLYRPVTKKGDPRIWFSRMSRFFAGRNVLAMVTDGQKIYIMNLSDRSVRDSLRFGPIAEFLTTLRRTLSYGADVLLQRMIDIHQLGFVESTLSGDTAVGMTLESLLGIKPNASKEPDFMGVEIKARRTRPERKTGGRQTLISRVPNWKKSGGMTAVKLLQEFGYLNEHGRKQLYCTVHAKPNPLGLRLSTDEEADQIILSHVDLVSNHERDVVYWDLSTLQEEISKKHKETFWVAASVQKTGTLEAFRYDSVVYTREPLVTAIPALIDQGKLTLDLTLSEKETAAGNSRVRDHGYLFRMMQDQRDLLFPSPLTFELSKEFSDVIVAHGSRPRRTT